MHTPDKTLDIQGIAGQRVRTIAEQALSAMQPGQLLKLVTAARDAHASVAALCHDAGYSLVDEARDGSMITFLIRR